jgi:hypothetical protein
MWRKYGVATACKRYRIRHFHNTVQIRHINGDRMRAVYDASWTNTVYGIVCYCNRAVIRCTTYGYRFQAENYRNWVVYGRLRTVLFDPGLYMTTKLLNITLCISVILLMITLRMTKKLLMITLYRVVMLCMITLCIISILLMIVLYINNNLLMNNLFLITLCMTIMFSYSSSLNLQGLRNRNSFTVF